MIRIKPKRSLGQNFLNDKNIARKMVRLFAPSKTDTIIEIGPGTGILTEFLSGTCGNLFLVEKDDRAASYLENKYKNDDRIKVLKEDILSISPAGIVNSTRTVRVIGNIPYNITSPILYHLLEERKYISDIMLLVQREVAERIRAKPATPDYGILSVLMQTWASTAFLFSVPPTVFYPRPSVTSAVIHITVDRRRNDIPDERLYQKIVRGTFEKRRKMLRSSVKSIFPDVKLHPDAFSIDLNKRPEECAVNDFITLTDELYHVINRRN